ncbi:hypothetical protein FRB98_000605 [Tulasnella sp. 332]|nr:hypothetical protein FRB98_000605 [Tulasnella sp. 332]
MSPAPSEKVEVYDTQAHQRPHDELQPKSACWRLLKTFALASTIYLLLGTAFGSIFSQPKYMYWAEPRPADGDVLSCDLGWSDPISSGEIWTMTSSTTLPIVEASTLFFHSTGSHAFGTILFVTAEPSSLARDDVAVVEFQVKYWDSEAWESATVCTMHRRESEYGIGIYTGDWRRWERTQLVFDVKVTLPASQEEPLILGAIETQLGFFNHELGDLAPAVFLDAARLYSSNAHIHVKSVSAGFFDGQTSNAAIGGSFKVTDKLSLVSSNGHVEVDVQATNGDWEEPTEILLKTSNAHISASISLYASEGADSVKSKASGLHLTTTTTNAYLDIEIPTAPPNSHLTYVGRTANARASLALPPAFEGKITGRTSLSTVGFHHDDSPSKDPTGDGRTRHYGKETHVRGLFGVETWWGNSRDEHTKLGSADVTTSLAAVSISLL